MNKPNVSVILDKRRETTRGENKGKFHIKIKVVFKSRDGENWIRIRRIYKTGLFASEVDFKKIRTNARAEDHKDIAEKLRSLEVRAKKIIEENGRFINTEIFEREFTDIGGYDNIVQYFDKVIESNDFDDNVGNAAVYLNAKNSFIYFSACQDKRLKSLFERNKAIAEERKRWKRTNAAGRAKLTELREELAANEKAIRANRVIPFFEVTPAWLMRYQKWMGDKLTACAMNTRCMRAIWNKAIHDKRVPADLYPFARNRHDKNKYAIPQVSGTRFALSEEQLHAIISYNSDDKGLIMARDFWHLTYLLYGLNMIDIARLRFKDLQKGALYIERHKTRNTNKIKKNIGIPIDQAARDIINKYGNRSLDPEEYVFPILTRGQTAKQDKKRVQDFLKWKVNLPMAKIGNELQLPFKVTTYIARHTFATLALIRGASILFIMDCLGHTNPKTTLTYFHGFDIETKKRIMPFVPRG